MVEIIHVDTNRQYSITASQNIFNPIYMTSEHTSSNQGSRQPAKRGRPIGTCKETLTRCVKIKSVNIELGTGSLIWKGQYQKCLSTCQLSGVKVQLYMQTHALAFLAWLSLLDNIQNSLLGCMLHVFTKQWLQLKGSYIKGSTFFQSNFHVWRSPCLHRFSTEAGNYLYKALFLFYRKIDPSKSKGTLQERLWETEMLSSSRSK